MFQKKNLPRLQTENHNFVALIIVLDMVSSNLQFDHGKDQISHKLTEHLNKTNKIAKNKVIYYKICTD